MAGAVSLTGKDTAILNTRIFRDFADGDVITLEFPNDVMTGKTGKGGNTIIAFNATGRNCDITIRVLLGSSDDKFLNSELVKYVNDPASYVPLQGQFIKRVGDGTGTVNSVTYDIRNGILSKLPATKDNQEGDTEQSVAVWNMKAFAVERAIA